MYLASYRFQQAGRGDLAFLKSGDGVLRFTQNVTHARLFGDTSALSVSAVLFYRSQL